MVKKKFFNPVWIINSTAMLVCSFLFVGYVMDFVFALIAYNFGIFGNGYEFDAVRLKEGGEFYTRVKVLVLFISVFALLGILILLNNVFYKALRTQKSILKLFFLWNYLISISILFGYIAIAALGEKSDARNAMERKFRIIWEYLFLNPKILPLFTAVTIAAFAFIGSYNFNRFLNMVPSSVYVKEKAYRLAAILNLVIIPLAIFSLVGQSIYGIMPTESRYIVMMILWGPAIIMLYRAYNTSFLNNRVLAIQGSKIAEPNYVLWGVAFGASVLTYLLF